MYQATSPAKSTTSKSSQPSSLEAGHVHIDRLTVSGPLAHKPLGELIFKDDPMVGLYPVGASPYTPKRRRNALPDEMFVKSHEVQNDEMAYRIRFDCCPPAILQGHNVFGHADALDYVNVIFDRQLAKHGLTVEDVELQLWREGREVHLSQVHLCANFWLPSDLKKAFINAIDEANSSGKHRDIESCITLGFGPVKRSTHHTVCIYDKHALLQKAWKDPGDGQARLMAMMKDTIRIEVRLYEGGLAYRNLKPLKNWVDLDTDALFFDVLKEYSISNVIQPELTADEQKMLSKTELVTYTLWLLKQDLGQLLSESTISRHQRSIKSKTGIDIRGRRQPAALPAVDLSEVLTPANIVPVPSWLPADRYWTVGRRH